MFRFSSVHTEQLQRYIIVCPILILTLITRCLQGHDCPSLCWKALYHYGYHCCILLFIFVIVIIILLLFTIIVVLIITYSSVLLYNAPLLPCHACRWYFSCSDWLNSAQGASKVLPALLEDPRHSSPLVQYQVRPTALHLVCIGIHSQLYLFTQATLLGA